MDNHFREPIFAINTDGVITAGVRTTDDDDPALAFACSVRLADWMVRRAYAALLAKEIAHD